MVTLQFIIKQWENLTVQCEILLCPVMGESRTTVQAYESTGDWTKHNEIWATYLYYIFVMLISAFNNVKHTPFGNSTRVPSTLFKSKRLLKYHNLFFALHLPFCSLNELTVIDRYEVWTSDKIKLLAGETKSWQKTSRKRLEKSFWIKRNASYFRLRR